MSDEQEPLTHHPSPITHHAVDRTQLRRSMRQQRNAVPDSVRCATATAICQHALRARLLRPGQRIAVYAAFDGEIDITPIVRQAQRAHCVVYAPRIVNKRARKMEFIELPRFAARYTRRHKQSSIAEPRTQLHRRIDPRLLDVVFVPLVAFDTHGWRLGFGAGFYDRKFAFMRRPFQKKPLLIGVGYEFQRVANQKPSPWDVLLDAVITERGIRRCRFH